MGKSNQSQYDPTNREERVVETLYRVANFVGDIADLNRLLTVIMQESEDLLYSEASSCMLYDPEQEELFFEVALGQKAEQIKQVRLKRGLGVAWASIKEKKPLIVNQAQKDKRHYSDADEISQFVTRNLIATPMFYRGDLIGCLEVVNKKDEKNYNPNDARILEIIADQAAMAIANARLIEENIQRERLAAAGRAVNDIAHHLKNIVLTVKGPISLIKLSVQKNRPEVLQEAIPILERGATRMERSVTEMLDYSKERTPELEKCSPLEIIQQVIEESQARADERGISLRIYQPEALPPTWLDKNRLHDAILNIVGNAIEAQPKSAQAPYIEIRLRFNPTQHCFIIKIEDNGPGIPPDIQKRIFQPFFSTKGSKGTGLGLALARKVARENGGNLQLQSEVDKGACFVFTLPVIEDPGIYEKNLPARQEETL